MQMFTLHGPFKIESWDQFLCLTNFKGQALLLMILPLGLDQEGETTFPYPALRGVSVRVRMCLRTYAGVCARTRGRRVSVKALQNFSATSAQKLVIGWGLQMRFCHSFHISALRAHHLILGMWQHQQLLFGSWPSRKKLIKNRRSRALKSFCMYMWVPILSWRPQRVTIEFVRGERNK